MWGLFPWFRQSIHSASMGEWEAPGGGSERVLATESQFRVLPSNPCKTRARGDELWFCADLWSLANIEASKGENKTRPLKSNSKEKKNTKHERGVHFQLIEPNKSDNPVTVSLWMKGDGCYRFRVVGRLYLKDIYSCMSMSSVKSSLYPHQKY